jgi:hypothetical protein
MLEECFGRETTGRAGLRSTIDVIQTDVRPLAINSSGQIFAETYFGGDVFRSTGDGASWMPVNKRLGVWKRLVSGDQFNRRDFAGTACCGGYLPFH